MAELAIQQACKRFGSGPPALDELEFDLADGELLVLVGPSGCGKTTTLRTIAGLETLDSGTVRIGGDDVTRHAPRDRNVAMVFQGCPLLPHLDVRRQLAFPLRMRKRPAVEIARRVDEVAKWVGIDCLMARRPHELSGGQRQQVALARALVGTPDVSLFDEPMAHLDAPLRRSLRAEFRSLHARLGMTAVYVTHDQEEALALGHRVAVMRSGHIEQIGTPEEIYLEPANRFVAQFIGSPPMNFLPGRISVEADDAWFVAERLRLHCAPSAAEQLRRHSEKAVILGIRPTDLRPLDVAGSGEWNAGANRLVATVTAAETLGAMTDLDLSCSGLQLLCRVSGGFEFPVGRQTVVQVDPARMHFFSTDDGRRL